MVGWPTVTNIVGGYHIVCSVFAALYARESENMRLRVSSPQGRLTELAGAVTCDVPKSRGFVAGVFLPPVMKWICA